MLITRATHRMKFNVLANHPTHTVHHRFNAAEITPAFVPAATITAVPGCDIASVFFNQEKWKTLKTPNLTHSNKTCHALMEAFRNTSSTHEDIASTEDQVFLSLYGETTFETSNAFRPAAYRLVINKTSIANTLEMANLPPSSEGARRYSYRMHLQTQQWLGINLEVINWG